MAIPTTERLATLEQKVDDVKSDVTEIKDTLKELPLLLEKRYASKLTERIVYGLCGFILIAVIAVILAAVGLYQEPSGSSKGTTIISTTPGTTSSSSTTAPASGGTTTETEVPATTTTTTQQQPAQQSSPSLLRKLGL